MAVLPKESLANATGFEQHDDFLVNYSSHDLQTYYDSMENGAEDPYNRTWSGMDLLTSAYSPSDSVPETPQACLELVDKNRQISQEQHCYPTCFDDTSLLRNLDEQDPSERCQASGSSGSTYSGIGSTNQPEDDFMNLITSHYPFPPHYSLFYYHRGGISLSANPITDDRTPDMTDCSTPASSSICQNKPSCFETSASDFKTDNQRWHATQSRLRAADQSFLYGVLTTKIFCRPSCASRRPSRRYVRFFPFPGAIEAALQTNFRPCKRCKPELLGTTNTSVLGISQVLRHIIAEANNQNASKPKDTFKLETLAQSAGLSPFHFHRLFKATTQLTPGDFITVCRALALQDALGKDRDVDDGHTTTNIKLAGWVDYVTKSLSFTPRTARKALGNLSPVLYANDAPGTAISYCSVETPCGRVYVAFSNSNFENLESINLHAVLIGPDAEKRIRLRFPASKMVEGMQSGVLEECVRGLEEEARDRDTEIGDDVLGGLWRARVWSRMGELGSD